MKKILFIISLAIILVVSVIFVCTKYNIAETRDVPDIETFSNELVKYEKNQYAEIERAILIKNGEAVTIDRNDEKLIRLLNFCAYSDEIGYSVVSVGQVSNYNYEQEDRLEVYFSGVKSLNVDYKLDSYDKMVVTSEKIWLIQTNPLHESVNESGVCAISWQPYGICDDIKDLNLLSYAEF